MDLDGFIPNHIKGLCLSIAFYSLIFSTEIIIGVLTFVLSSVLNNLTVVIVMVLGSAYVLCLDGLMLANSWLRGMNILQHTAT